MNTLKFRLTGSTPLMMHNERLANPMDEFAKEMKKISGKKKKTDEDFELMAQIEFRGGLYIDEDEGPYIPNRMIEATVREGAKRTKRGKDVARGFEVLGLDHERAGHLIYKGPRTRDGLWNGGFFDQRTVKVGMSRVVRTRPIFREWAIDLEVAYDTEIFNEDDIKTFFDEAGRYAGIGDYRPRYGRFAAETI